MARYEIVDVRTRQVIARHRTRQAAIDGWRIDHAGVPVRIERTYPDGTRRVMVDGTWRFADDVHDSAPTPAPGPVPRPLDEQLTALRRVGSLVEGPLTSAAYRRLHEPSKAWGSDDRRLIRHLGWCARRRRPRPNGRRQ